ncbi:MAG: DUF6044 family protein [Candidatus Omnitrophota bacterium]
MKRTFNYNIIVCILFIGFLFAFPRIFLGEDSYVTIHDNLDIGSIWFIRHIEKSNIFNPQSLLDNTMNGLPRPFLTTGSAVMLALFLLFKPFTAYVINELLVHLLAFIGMYLLLKRHVLKSKDEDFIAFGVSVCFAALPFYSLFGLSVAGQPLLLYAFLNLINNKKHILDFMIIFIFPFYAPLYYAGFAILIALGILFIFYYISERKANKLFLSGLILFSISYVFVEFNFIKMAIFDNNLAIHRMDWNPLYLARNYKEAMKLGFKNFLFGDYNAPSKHTPIILVSFLSILTVFLANRKAQLGNTAKSIFILLLIAFSISLFHGLYHWEGLVLLKEKIDLLRVTQFNRFFYLETILWYIVFALSLFSLLHLEHGKSFVRILIISQLIFIFTSKFESKNELSINYKIIFERAFGKEKNRLTYGKFFSETLFSDIDEYLGLPKKTYRLVSIGIHPSILQYNGFYTLDSYQNVYPLIYKHRFREIIAKELDKSTQLKDYFDYWGNRCYIFVAELEDEGFTITKERNIKIHNLELNTNALKKLGGRFILSAVQILNAKDNNLALLKIFERDDSPWQIYLYKVDS